MNLSSIRSAEASHAIGRPTVDDATPTSHEHVGFELGWDHARHKLEPPAPYDQQHSSLRNGLLAGRAAMGGRSLPATPAVRKWLQLRLHAWLRGRSFELLQVTPRYLQQIDARFCPVTRIELDETVSAIDRVRNDAGYAAGNLAVISAQANRAKGAHGFADAMRCVRQLEDRPLLEIGGLGAAAWRRIAILCSFVEPMPHADACTLPLLVLPPRRLHLLNPVQALQAMISCQLLQPGWSKRSRSFEALLHGQAQRRAYQAFFHAYLPRVLEAVPPAVRQARGEHDLQQLRWAIEDAWNHPPVLRHWTAFARLLDAAGCERLIERFDALRLGPLRSASFSDAQATEGWNLESRGYVPHAELRRRSPPRRMSAAIRQSCLPL
ncbi:hypothetical protein [Piscinibacter sakaiensis]|uniref:hypothetical protein n=1 Tax=Piscinibacter sakaiensis TaxID=1547922 RepID=UPI003AACFF49